MKQLFRATILSIYLSISKTRLAHKQYCVQSQHGSVDLITMKFVYAFLVHFMTTAIFEFAIIEVSPYCDVDIPACFLLWKSK